MSPLVCFLQMVEEQNSDKSNQVLTLGREETIQEVLTKFARSHPGRPRAVDFWRRMHGEHQLTSKNLSWSMVGPKEKVGERLNPDGRTLELEWVAPPRAPQTYTIALRRQGPNEEALMLGEKLTIYETLGIY